MQPSSLGVVVRLGIGMVWHDKPTGHGTLESIGSRGIGIISIALFKQ